MDENFYSKTKKLSESGSESVVIDFAVPAMFDVSVESQKDDSEIAGGDAEFVAGFDGLLSGEIVPVARGASGIEDD